MIHGYFVHILVFHTKLEDYSACKGSGFTTNLGQNVLFCYLFLLYIYIYIYISFLRGRGNGYDGKLRRCSHVSVRFTLYTCIVYGEIRSMLGGGRSVGNFTHSIILNIDVIVEFSTFKLMSLINFQSL